MTSIMKARRPKKSVSTDRSDCVSDVHSIRIRLESLLDLLEEKKRGHFDASEADALDDIVSDITSRAHILSHKIRTSCGKR